MYKIKRFAMTSEEKREKSKRKKHDAKRDLAYGAAETLGATAAIPATASTVLSRIDAKDGLKKAKASRDELSKAKEYIRQEIKNGGSRYKGPLGRVQAEVDRNIINLLEDRHKLNMKYAKSYRDVAKNLEKLHSLTVEPL